jgi:hypothetical protein
MSDDDDLMEFVRGKWYEPITVRIEEFENNSNMFPEFQSVAEPNSPEWAVQCAIRGFKPFADVAGLPFDDQFGAKNVGALVGAKSSICGAMAKAHEWAATMKVETRNKFVEVFGEDALREAKAVWKKFADKLHPEFEGVRRLAVNLSMKQSYLEDLEFHRGLTKGLTFMLEIRKSIRKAVRKAERDAQNRAAVYFFAITGCKAIEANRQQLSWPELNKAFNETFDYQIPIDEDAFKKILQRCGLRIGKPGRPIPIGS